MTNGDAVVPELAEAAAVDPGEVLVWRDMLNDGPVPGGLGADELARVRANFLASRGAGPAALAMLRERDARLAGHPAGAEIVLWFEDDLFDALLLAQVEDRLVGRPSVTRVRLPHPPRGDLAAALAAREPIEPDGAAFAALRSSDPRAWTAIPAFARLLEELPDSLTGLSRLEHQILSALAGGPLTPGELFPAAVAGDDPPWAGDDTVFALAAGLEPLVAHDGGRYVLTAGGADVLAGRAVRPPVDRWLGGVHLGPGRPDWVWDAGAGVPVLRTAAG